MIENYGENSGETRPTDSKKLLFNFDIEFAGTAKTEKFGSGYQLPVVSNMFPDIF